jgi:type IV secretory pathway VirB2 component (pilin)
MLRRRGQRNHRSAPRRGDDQPSFVTMMGLVALVVAIVILVFFGIGYLFGRIFL